MQQLLNKYNIIGIIGKGTFGKDWLVESNGVKYVAKQITKDEINDQTLRGKSYMRQSKAMKHCEGDHLLKLYAEDEGKKRVSIDANNRFLIVEYLQSSLEKLVKEKKGTIDLGLAVKIVADVLRGLQELRTHGCNHLNLKPTNVLLTGSQPLRVKLCDFEMLVEENERFSIPNISHLSPDFVLEHTECEAADIWSVGGLLFFMLNGRLPFEFRPSNAAELSQRCEGFSYKDYAKIKQDQMDDRLQVLFRRLFDPEPKTRISLQQLQTQLNVLVPNTFSSQQIKETSKIYAKEFVPANYLDLPQKKKIPEEWSQSIDMSEFRIGGPLQKPVARPSKADSLNMSEFEISYPQNNVQQQAPRAPHPPSTSPPSVKVSVVPTDSIPIGKITIKPLHTTEQKPFIKAQEPMNTFVEKHNTIIDKRHNIYSFNHERNKFLHETSLLASRTRYFPDYLKFALAYLTLKLFIVYELEFKKYSLNRMLPEHAPIDLDWNGYFEGPLFKSMLQEIDTLVSEATAALPELYEKCMMNINKLEEKVPNFREALQKVVSQTSFQGEWKKIYRSITNLAYSSLDRYYGKLSSTTPRTEKINVELGEVYNLLMKVFICHSINQMFRRSLIPELYKEYFNWRLKNESRSDTQFDFGSFRRWLAADSIDNLQKVSTLIKEKIFSQAPLKQ